jgi:hypothetical protein
MTKSLLAGTAYGLAAFATGAALGIVRTVWLMPAVGELASVALQAPIMLAFTWWLSARLVRALGVPAAGAERMAMGWTAFALVMLAELILAVSVAGRGVTEHFADYFTAPGLLVLVAQVAFAFIPWLQLSRTVAYVDSQLS